MADADPATAARKHLLSAHAETIDAVLEAADAVATTGAAAEDASWFPLGDGRLAAADREALVPALRVELEDADVLDALPDLLASAVDAAGYSLAAPPVPAPPYVAVTSTGPVLRATVADGRLVVDIDCFEVVREVDGGGNTDRDGDAQGGSDAGGGATEDSDAGGGPTGESNAEGVVYARTASNPAAALSVSFTGK